MSRKTILAIAVAASVSPVTAMAQAESGFPSILSSIGISLEDVTAGGPFESAEGDVTFSAAVLNSGMIMIDNLSLVDGETEVSFARFLLQQAGGKIMFSDVSLKSLSSPESGTISIASGEMSDDRLAERMLSGDFCVPVGTEIDPSRILDVNLSGITVEAMGEGALAPVPNANVLPVQIDPETIEIRDIRTSFETDTSGSCVSPTSASISDVSITSVDGDAGKIGSIDMSGSAVTAPGKPIFLDIVARSVTAVDETGKQISELAETSFKAALGYELASMLNTAVSGGGEPEMAQILEVMKRDEAGLRMMSSGINMPISDLLPPDVLARLGIPAGQVVSGSVGYGAGISGGILDFGYDIDLSGLAKTTAKVDMSFGDGAGAAALGDLAGQRPEVAMAAYLMLKYAEFSYQDNGLGQIVETTTGLTPPEVVREIRGIVGPIPAPIADPIFRWLEDISVKGGKVTASPPQPVGLIELGMMGMMNPAMLQGMLNLKTE